MDPGGQSGLAGASAMVQPQRRRWSKQRIRRAVWGYIFLMPWLLRLLFFAAGPILASLFFSFTRYNILGTPKFTGIQNYGRALLGEHKLFWS